MKKSMRFSFLTCMVLFGCMPFLTTGSNPGEYSRAFFHPNQNLKTYRPAQELIDIQVELVNCPAWGYCSEIPEIRLSFNEAGGQSLGYSIFVQIGADNYEFDTSPAEIYLPTTTSEGIYFEYWAQSSSGLILAENKFRMRNELSGNEYYLELLGSQWEHEAPGCAVAWNVFPPRSLYETGWAQPIANPDDLFTSIDYTLLAGRLIWEGVVNAENCEDNGLLANGAANPCGMEAAEAEVLIRQNTANAAIQKASYEAYVPARLLKGLIGQESQFYPNWVREGEYGLGMLTEKGADMLLNWNEPFYMEKCSEIYNKDYCRNGYENISVDYKAHLIGYVMQDIGTEQEYRLLAETMYAGCYQTGQMVRNYTDMEPNEVADYATLWRITMGMYHAGCGCLGNAIEAAWEPDSQTLSWVNIAANLKGDCSNAVDYFDKVVKYGK
jgi:hypothetical protein